MMRSCEKSQTNTGSAPRNKRLKVAAYCRVSTKSKAQRASLMNQIWCYTEQILNHNDWKYAGIYFDFGKSGLRKRDELG